MATGKKRKNRSEKRPLGGRKVTVRRPSGCQRTASPWGKRAQLSYKWWQCGRESGQGKGRPTATKSKRRKLHRKATVRRPSGCQRTASTWGKQAQLSYKWGQCGREPGQHTSRRANSKAAKSGSKHAMRNASILFFSSVTCYASFCDRWSKWQLGGSWVLPFAPLVPWAMLLCWPANWWPGMAP
jgi:transposase-like protein